MGARHHMAGLSPAYPHTLACMHVRVWSVVCPPLAVGASAGRNVRRSRARALPRAALPPRSVTLSALQHAPRTPRALLHMVLLSLAYWLKAAALRTSMHADHRTWPGRRLSSRWRRGHCRGTKSPKSGCSLVRRRPRCACRGRVMERPLPRRQLLRRMSWGWWWVSTMGASPGTLVSAGTLVSE